MANEIIKMGAAIVWIALKYCNNHRHVPKCEEKVCDNDQ